MINHIEIDFSLKKIYIKMCLLEDRQSWVIGVLMLGMNDKLEISM